MLRRRNASRGAALTLHALLTLICPLMATAAGPDGAWSVVPPPTGRLYPAAFYEETGHRVVVFGGLDGAARNEIWTLDLDGLAWNVLDQPGIVPPERSEHSLVHEPTQGRWVVFGGSDQNPFNPNEQLLDDVWALSLEGGPSWTEIHPSGAPPSARKRHTAVYDAAGDRMIVFGGNDGGLRNDVWELDLSGAPAWSQMFPSGDAPAAREGHVAMYDSARGRMLVFGGDSGVHENDVWALDLSGPPSWTQLSPSGGPPAGRENASALHDAARDRWIVFGGFSTGELHGDLWSLSLDGGTEWAEITPDGDAPGARAGHRAVLEPVSERMIVLGGSSSGIGLPTNVWSLSLTDPILWSELATQTGPIAKMSLTAVYDAADDRVVVFGGRDGMMASDVWALSLADPPEWTEIPAAGDAPSQPVDHAAVYDPVRDRMVVFAGELTNEGGVLTSETWELSLGAQPVWAQIGTSGGPPDARLSHTAVYDPSGDRMIVFGGSDGTALRNDIWELSFQTDEWTELQPAGPLPVPRRDHVAAYDSARDLMLVFGGIKEFFPFLNDVWALDLSGAPAWAEIEPAGPLPEPPLTHAGLYDPVRDRLVTFGGSYHNETWELAFTPEPAWNRLAPSGAPPTGRVDHAVAYDPVGDRMVSFGGHSGLAIMADTWLLDWDDPSGLVSSASAPWSARTFPNPARDAVTIRFEVPRPGPTSLVIYDARGRLVRRLVHGLARTGVHAVRWDLRTERGESVAAGVYLYELRLGGIRRAGRILAVR